MKKCPYCGKEYPDDTMVCPTDRQPLASDAAPSPPAKRFPIDMRAHFATRPREVKVAVGLLGAGLALDTIMVLLGIAVYHPPSRNPDFYFTTAFNFVAAWLLLYFVFRGKNWARWLTLCLIVLGIVWPFPPHHRLTLRFYLYSLIDIAAIVLLFQRPTGKWYTKSKYVDENPQSVS
jgi:hypothetical protein